MTELRRCPSTAVVVLIGPSGAGKSTIARTWPASQVLSLDALCEVVSDDFPVNFSVLKRTPPSGARPAHPAPAPRPGPPRPLRQRRSPTTVTEVSPVALPDARSLTG